MFFVRRALCFAAALCSLAPAALAHEHETAQIWQLQNLDGQAVNIPITLELGTDGTVSGKGPCNSYNSSNSAQLPGFELGPLASTRMACEHLELEGTYFAALITMRTAEIIDDTLTLRSLNGAQLLFTAAE
ncbi:MAG: META domain-containing protein [Mangrovicoccus sp.]|nr:META domain-containing protein [Mangrovicoccus sp.]